MLDTSGSMSDNDISYAVSQLQVMGNGTDGIVVPCDAAPRWDKATRIKKINDLKRTKVVGRGGTIFDDFFENFPKELGTDFDVIVILTDGYCGNIPIELKPPIPVVWVVTSDFREFKPSFGKVAPLRHEVK